MVTFALELTGLGGGALISYMLAIKYDWGFFGILCGILSNQVINLVLAVLVYYTLPALKEFRTMKSDKIL
jgi:hypothetical protein